MRKDRIEQAYQTLGLENGASMTEIEEASQRLLSRWHPDLFPYSRKLQDRSKEKQREIQEAFDVLCKDHAWREQKPMGASPERGELFEKPKADLFEETLSDRLRRKPKRYGFWLGIGAFFILGFTFTYLGRSAGEERPIVPKFIPPPAEAARRDSAEPAAKSDTEDLQSSEPVAADEPVLPPPTQPARAAPEKPRLLREKVETEASAADAEENRSLEEAEEARRLSERAFQLLREKSPAAVDLVSGRNPRYKFQDWTIVKQEPNEIWIDVTAVRASGAQELHFVWAIDPQKQTIRPLSQAARDLEQ